MLSTSRVQSIIAVAALLLVSACATPPKQQSAPVFYPEPPEYPRLQYLTHLTGAKDVEGEKGTFEAFVTGVKESRNRLDKPYGVALHNGKLYVCDTNQNLMVFDLEKKTYGTFPGAKGLGKLVQPLNISIDREGNKYVADPVRGQVVAYDRNDIYTAAFGMPGKWRPVDAVPLDGRLYVADIKNGEIVVFDIRSGSVVKRFGREGDVNETLYKPTNIAFDQEGYLYISDAGKFQIYKYDRDGHFIRTFGRLGDGPSSFARPRGVAVDRAKRLYGVDAAFDNVQIFNELGGLLMFFGKAGRGPGDMYLPAKVLVDYDHVRYFESYADPNFQVEHLVLVTNQFGDRMVSVYGFGREKGREYPSEKDLMQLAEEKLRKMQEKEPQKVEDEGTEAK